MFAILAALLATAAVTAVCLFAGFVAAMPEGLVARRITGRDRLELYLGSTSCLFLMGHAWLSAAI